MSFKKVSPKQQFTSDATFFNEGIRFSNRFILKEKLDDFNYAEVFIDKDAKRVGFKFLKEHSPQSLKLTKSGGSTHGKTISCVFLKDYDWIKRVMERFDIGSRRFSVQKIKSTENKKKINYFIKIK